MRERVCVRDRERERRTPPPRGTAVSALRECVCPSTLSRKCRAREGVCVRDREKEGEMFVRQREGKREMFVRQGEGERKIFVRKRQGDRDIESQSV